MAELVIGALQFGSKVAVGIIVAAASAYLAFRWSVRRFISERRWERKLEAYSDLLGSLHDMKHYPERYMDREIRGFEILEAERDMLFDGYTRAHAALRKQMDIGTLIIGARAIEALNLLQQELDEASSAETIFEHTDSQLAAIRRCLDEIRTIAVDDLRIGRRR